MARELHNIALCYHGFTASESEKTLNITYIGDFKKQIKKLMDSGYEFVKPSKYWNRYTSLTKSYPPAATVIFADALESIGLATMWLAEKLIPFGIAVSGKQLGKQTPRKGYLSWKDLSAAIDSGFCEILHNTYNMHHFCLEERENEIVNSPVLKGPCYIDNGEFLYMASKDKHMYWDMPHFSNITWNFPLFGTDITTNKVIHSTVKFLAGSDILTDRMRIWTCLHNPADNGYGVKVQIRINGEIAADSIIEPKEYITGSQWPECEFVTIRFKKPYEIKRGNTYEIEFDTQNTGNAVFMIYAVPDFSGNFQLTSSCQGMTFPENTQWPARAAILLTDGTGKTVSSEQYRSYVKEDLNKNNQAISNYLNATWSTWSTSYVEDNKQSSLVLGGTYSNGQLAATKIKISTMETFTAEILRFKYASRLGKKYPLIMDVFINDRKVGTFEANWWDWNWQEIEIDPFEFIAGKNYIIKFETKNESPFGQGLVRVFMNQPKAPQPGWSSNLEKIIIPSYMDFNHESKYEVLNPEGTDVYPKGAIVDKDSNFKWVSFEPYDGPGIVFLEMLSCSSAKAELPTQLLYPYGSYYSAVIKSKLLPEKKDIHHDLKSILMETGVTSGFSLSENRADRIKNMNLQYSEYIMPCFRPDP